MRNPIAAIPLKMNFLNFNMMLDGAVSKAALIVSHQLVMPMDDVSRGRNQNAILCIQRRHGCRILRSIMSVVFGAEFGRGGKQFGLLWRRCEAGRECAKKTKSRQDFCGLS